MPDDGDLATRLEMLETRATHQDVVIEDLNATVTALWTRLEALSRHMAVITDRLREAEAQAGASTPVQRPPHY